MAANVKYQIFVSSTYEDLKEEREQVVKAILEMGHIPVGMEMFSAADEEQWSIIQRHIEASDYYVVIIAHRYGSMVDGISYTEKEYDYAVQKGVPALGFIIHDGAAWAESRRDLGPNSEQTRAKLKAFKEKVRRKPIDFWHNATELHGKVAISLMKTMTAQPRTGWITASQAASAEAAAELARLSKENADLRASLEQLRVASGSDARAAEVASTLREHKIQFVPNGRTLAKNVSSPPATLLELFELIAPLLAGGVSPADLAMYFADKLFGVLAGYHELEANFHIWVREFIIQDLVSCSTQTVHGALHAQTVDRWELTEFGRAFLRYRRRTAI